MYALYSHRRYFKFKRKNQQYGPRFQTIFTFLMTMDLHDYLLSPEKLEIVHNMLANYCDDTTDEYKIKVVGVKKLVLNLGIKSECSLL